MSVWRPKCLSKAIMNSLEINMTFSNELENLRVALNYVERPNDAATKHESGELQCVHSKPAQRLTAVWGT